MKTMFRYLPALLMGAVLGAFIAIGTTVFANRSQPNSSIPYEDLRTFTEIFDKIKTDYVEEVEDKKLLENAIQGMLSGLDPHSGYLDPETFRELQIGTTGEFGGLGIEVGMDNGFVKVIAPIDDTPAQRAGIQAGDLIVRLNDTPVKGMTLSDAVKIMRGEPDTNINLTIVRENEDKPIVLTITRAIIQVKSVKSRTLEPSYIYVRISHFQTPTGKDLEKAIRDLKEENKDVGLKGLVLDLRNNPGGVLKAAVSVSDAFLKTGLIVYTEGRVLDSSLRFQAHSQDLVDGIPIVVLVNSGSASASEIVAGALQDHRRAIIMGTKTFGKGSVQTILPMNNDAALKLTTARYFTPLGRSIQAEGIQPDILLSKVEIASVEQETDRITEADLNRHLDNGEKKSETKDDLTKDSSEEEPLVKRDYEVYEALNLLKGLNIIRD
ncbi:S41 family peptidase [Candidatus Halobeggiatoa sp. HSG11]|nr:S41 family peptidase [Candidatus Halobeggiatoa sp. HSG11]